MDKFKWTRGFGVKDKDMPGVSPDPDTIFRIGSVSKIFAVSCKHLATFIAYTNNMINVIYLVRVLSIFI